jgi:predicted nucleic acid-binding protein
MKYVLDASVAIKWVIVEPDSNDATRLREDYRNAIHDLISAESFAIECAYSLTKQQRQSLLLKNDAFFRTHTGGLTAR